MDTKLKVITMNKIILILIIASMFFTKGYAQQAEVLTLGVFHFEFPNLDVQQVSEEDQIDVLSPQYQREIELYPRNWHNSSRMPLSLNGLYTNNQR